MYWQVFFVERALLLFFSLYVCYIRNFLFFWYFSLFFAFSLSYENLRYTHTYEKHTHSHLRAAHEQQHSCALMLMLFVHFHHYIDILKCRRFWRHRDAHYTERSTATCQRIECVVAEARCWCISRAIIWMATACTRAVRACYTVGPFRDVCIAQKSKVNSVYSPVIV